ncbi:MAG: GNAT family N-acetyltransferase [Hyphomonadaceae bacterium]|nr:GNAT family N-acetyltransferase [Hyphomonadaceae bacterium]
MPVLIHKVSAKNTGLLGNVDPDVFDHEIKQDMLAAYLADKRHAMFVAVEDGMVVGQVRGNIHLQPDRASDLYLDNLGTATSHQRRGIATQLVQALVAWGTAQGCTFVWVATETDNTGAILFYEAQHFERITMEMLAIEIGEPADD